MTDPGTLSRRRLLVRSATLAAVGVAGPATAANVAPTTANASPYTPDGLARIARKVRFRLDEGLVFAWIFGTKYGQVEAELRPLLNFEAGAISRVRNTPEGFAVTTWERTFYAALQDDEPRRIWRTPYTGADIPTHGGASGPPPG